VSKYPYSLFIEKKKKIKKKCAKIITFLFLFVFFVAKSFALLGSLKEEEKEICIILADILQEL